MAGHCRCEFFRACSRTKISLGVSISVIPIIHAQRTLRTTEVVAFFWRRVTASVRHHQIFRGVTGCG
jgi:hypothetical protein